MTHRAYPVILDYSIMILYSTSNVSFGSNFCIHSRSFNSPEYPTESQRPYHGSMQTNGQSGCVLVGDHKATNGELNSKLIWGFSLSSKVIFSVVYCQKYKCHNQKYEYQLASALLCLILVHDVLVIRTLFGWHDIF